MRSSTAISVALESRPWPAACAPSREGPLARTALSAALVQSLAAARSGASSSPRPRRAAGGAGEGPRAGHAGQDDLLGGARTVAVRHGPRGIGAARQLPPEIGRASCRERGWVWGVAGASVRNV